MNSVHYDVIVYTKDIEKGSKKINKLITESNEMLYKSIPNVKYITDKRTYTIVNPYSNARGYRYYEAYIDKEVDHDTVSNYILAYCLPYSDNWKERIHYF